MLYIAENLRSLRKARDLTQEDVADMLNVSPQSVSKWERGDTMPEITLLPSLANLYLVSVDALIGMDRINNEQTKNGVFRKGYKLLREGAISRAVDIFSEAYKMFPNDGDYLSYLAMALALDGEESKLSEAIALCERVLSSGQGVKTCHTTRAALCFIYQKAGNKVKAIETASSLPHRRESREKVIAELEKDPSVEEINRYLKFIAIGEIDEQDLIT
jgi:transcriptional regulator with XRE-family HTH domain